MEPVFTGKDLELIQALVYNQELEPSVLLLRVATECFFGLGSRAAVRQALFRLCEEGLIQRVAKGVYVRPRISEYVGKVPPEPFLIAKAKAKSKGESIMVNGAEAARQLGLSTQMAVRDVFVTTGSPRKFTAQGQPIVVRHVSATKVKPEAGKVTLATVALEHLGRKRVTSEVVKQIKNSLTPAEFRKLLTFSLTMPEWVQKSLKGESLG